jgi:hypothetical protein
MTRIEWAAIGGDEVETVVSMFIYNEHPQAVRIRPSQGDFGIDVLDPRPPDRALADVYQIKKFATNLESSEKRQIENSFRRVLVGLVRRGIPLADWYLVMPLDLTIDNRLDWFKAMPEDVITGMFADEELALTEEEKATITAWREAPGRIIECRGLTECELLASKYPFVADYYLHGGSERIRSAVADVAKILQRDLTLPAADQEGPSTSVLEPGELREHLQRLGRVLDGDPHFRYGISIDPIRPELSEEPGLIAAAQESTPDGMCLTFRIYQRFAESLNERPIPIKLRFEFEPGSTEHQAFEAWRKYGKPFTGSVQVDADLPGGLGGTSKSATVKISPAGGGMSYENRFRVVGPDDTVVGEVRFILRSTPGPDGTGAWFQGHDPSGVLTVEGQFDATNGSGTANLSLSDPSGHDAADVAPAIDFAAALVHPNRIQIAGKYGPFQNLQDALTGEPLIAPFPARYIGALATIQAHTPRACFGSGV